MKAIRDLRQLSIEELNNELMNLRMQQFNMRLKQSNGVLKRTHVIRETRRSIARVKTIISDKAGDKDAS